MSFQSDIIIVGGGASGLMAAISCAKHANKAAPQTITILEHKDRIGKKLLATGNGKCNYTNLYEDSTVYRGDKPAFAYEVIKQFGVKETIDFFQNLGIYPKERRGYLYPSSEQASSVLDVLRLELEHLKIKIVCDVHVKSIEKRKEQFVLTTNQDTFIASKVIISTGGCASSDLGSDGSGYTIAKQLGHHTSELVPALTALRSKADYFKAVAGVRVEALIQLYEGEQLLAKETGELQLTNYGISGIPVFQISRFAGKAIKQHKKKPVYAMVDFMPIHTTAELHKLMEERIKSCGYKTMEEQMIGLFNKKLASVILKLSGIKLNDPSSKVSKKQMNQLVDQIKSFRIDIYEPNPFEQAQVTAGGVLTDEINVDSMESKLIKGLYFTGEIVDVDGTCGGYNLQWAWSSGYLAGKHAALPKEKGRGSKND